MQKVHCPLWCVLQRMRDEVMKTMKKNEDLLTSDSGHALLQAIFEEMQLIKKSMRTNEDRLLKTNEVAEMIGMTRVTIAAMVDAGQFPEPDWISESGYKRWWKSTIYSHFNKKQALAS